MSTIIAARGYIALACPFFFPTERVDNIALPHPARLPLGAAWRGLCEAPGQEQRAANTHEPNTHELESCNLGYATSCPRLPKQRTCDAVRFAVAGDSQTRISIQFSLEMGHVPAGHGRLEYDRSLDTWALRHPDPRIQKMAECFLRSHIERKNHM